MKATKNNIYLGWYWQNDALSLDIFNKTTVVFKVYEIGSPKKHKIYLKKNFISSGEAYRYLEGRLKLYKCPKDEVKDFKKQWEKI